MPSTVSTFIVRPIAADVAAEVRTARRAPDYGHPVHQETARGTGPCRVCLSAFDVGSDERLLFTYSPFDRTHSLAQPGPVFIHATECAAHVGEGYPAGLRAIDVVAQAHRRDGSIDAVRRVPAGNEDATLASILDDANVAFVHLRHGEAGCFIARVDRVDD